MPVAVRRRAALACAALVVIVLVVVDARSPAAAQTSSVDVYRPPVEAPVHDPFRAPATPFGPGHRGIEYDTAPDTPVAAAARGIIAFAGHVAGPGWVTIQHPDGVRTSYGPLATIAVAAGQPVVAGDVIGATAGRLLMTARVADNYVDPALLLSGADDEVHLVAEPTSLPSFPSSSFGVGDLLSPDALVAALSWGRDRATEQVAAVYGITPAPLLLHTVGALAEWRERQDHCTRNEVLATIPSNRRLAVLVGGLGSTSEDAAIDDIDTASLGYDESDVVRFSYRGGRVPTTQAPSAALAQLGVTTYTTSDSAGDLEVAGARLAELLSTIARNVPPGASVDVYAHSQGGLVALMALAELAARDPSAPSQIGVVVTLATPYHGTELAGLAEAVARPPFGRQFVDAVGTAAGTDLRVDDPAIGQLAPGSELLRRLAAHALPAGPAFVSIAAQGDAVVPSPDAHLSGATNVIVPVTGVDAHTELPGSAQVTREISMALAGLPPSCESASDAVLDAVWGDLFRNGERFLTATRTP
ncbi:MAG TPA: M23 family metallopeptidase [Acidimicrobiales bacterium]|nr:M23 family metallopeptidase [Acidimicrobiales bacterium]